MNLVINIVVGEIKEEIGYIFSLMNETYIEDFKGSCWGCSKFFEKCKRSNLSKCPYYAKNIEFYHEIIENGILVDNILL